MHRFARALAAAAGALALMACISQSGPEKALDSLATALDKNDSAAFLGGLDMPRFAENHMRALTATDPALGTLDALGSFLGLGNVDEILGNMVDMRGKLEAEFTRGVTSGELMARCRATIEPDCPWVPSSLREATIVELGPDAAIAKVTTPARITTWLALRKEGEAWRVVGQAVLEENARACALGKKSTSPQKPNEAEPARPSHRGQGGRPQQPQAKGATTI